MIGLARWGVTPWAPAIERGEFNLTVDTIAKIAAGLGMTASELFKRAKL